MANWLNLRLIVTGGGDAIVRFRRAAGALEGRIDTRHSSVFTSAMEIGESGDLEADEVEMFGAAFRQVSYRFQGRDTDHVAHFRKVSRKFSHLAFVLVWSDPNADSHGSHLLLNAAHREWMVDEATKTRLLRRQYRTAGVVNARGKIDYEADAADDAEQKAFFEMMDVAARHWDGAVRGWLEKQRTEPPIRSSTRRYARERGGIARRQRLTQGD